MGVSSAIFAIVLFYMRLCALFLRPLFPGAFFFRRRQRYNFSGKSPIPCLCKRAPTIYAAPCPARTPLKHTHPRQNPLWGTMMCFNHPYGTPLKHTYPRQNPLWGTMMCFNHLHGTPLKHTHPSLNPLWGTMLCFNHTPRTPLKHTYPHP